MAMKYILQVFSGFPDSPAEPAETVIRKIDRIASRVDVDKVIIGWNRDASLYEKTGAFLHSRGIRMFLWLPVFSEVSRASEPDPASDIFGKEIAAPARHGGEAFRFVCPSSPQNARIATDVYDRFFSGCGFDGVFLDRIRGQSFETGVSGVLSCGCARCRKAFLKRGVDIGDVAKLYAKKKDAFFDVSSWPMNGQFVAEDPLVQRFFEAKETIVADAVTGITRYFKDKGLFVGLDLFAPVISRFTGQNYSLITKYADFIKPMLYRRTEAPAGIAYEYALFRKCAAGARGCLQLTMDRQFLHTQLQAIEDLPCEKYPGVEINFDRKLVKTDPEYILESLNAIREHGFDGAALCWNVTQAPDRHIDAISSFASRDRE